MLPWLLWWWRLFLLQLCSFCRIFWRWFWWQRRFDVCWGFYRRCWVDSLAIWQWGKLLLLAVRLLHHAGLPLVVVPLVHLLLLLGIRVHAHSHLCLRI